MSSLPEDIGDQEATIPPQPLLPRKRKSKKHGSKSNGDPDCNTDPVGDSEEVSKSPKKPKLVGDLTVIDEDAPHEDLKKANSDPTVTKPRKRRAPVTNSLTSSTPPPPPLCEQNPIEDLEGTPESSPKRPKKKKPRKTSTQDDTPPPNPPPKLSKQGSSDAVKPKPPPEPKPSEKPNDNGKAKGGFFSLFSKKKDDDKKDKKKSSGKGNEKKVYIINTFADFDEELKKKFKKARISEEKIQNNLPIMLNVLHFLTKDVYKMSQGGSGGSEHRSEKRNYASEALMQHASTVLSPVNEKDPKKLFRNLEFSNKGGFGRVFGGKDTETKKRIAIKKLPNLSDKEKRNNLCEIGFLSTCDHPNIVQFQRALQVKEEVWIVTEFLEGGTLNEAVKVHLFSERHIAYVSREILKALEHLHSLGYVHRDLKSGNVMMSIDGDIKLIDFGLCCDVNEGPRLQMLGSPFWIPPEMIAKKSHERPADIWSFAVCILEMYLKEPPHSESRMYAMFTAATDGLKMAIPDRASPEARDFLSQCLEINPKKRATATELLDHPFVTQEDLELGIEEVLRGVFVSNSLALSGI